MTALPAQEHWNDIYSKHRREELSWFQPIPSASLDLLLVPSLKSDDAILDVGGGASGLAGALLDRGFSRVSVLDISDRAIQAGRVHLAERGDKVRWIQADIRAWQPDGLYRAWHDRAAFHFLTDERDRAAYVRVLHQAVRAGGLVVIGTFAADGPERCSGLSVRRYSPEMLATELGSDFRWTASRKVEHTTPAGLVQKFQFSRFVRE